VEEHLQELPVMEVQVEGVVIKLLAEVQVILHQLVLHKVIMEELLPL
tara:strand:+ start:167 stop:307 length:141 start_codon:yes stop_codon:yes gene_type:complete